MDRLIVKSLDQKVLKLLQETLSSLNWSQIDFAMSRIHPIPRDFTQGKQPANQQKSAIKASYELYFTSIWFNII